MESVLNCFILNSVTDFSDFFSSVSDDRREYIDGLLVTWIIFLFLFLRWGLILVMLKYKGNEVGCASGRGFVSLRSYDESSRSNEESSDVQESKADDGMASTSDSSGAETGSKMSTKPLFKRNGLYATASDDNSDSFVDSEDNLRKILLESKVPLICRISDYRKLVYI